MSMSLSLCIHPVLAMSMAALLVAPAMAAWAKERTLKAGTPAQVGVSAAAVARAAAILKEETDSGRVLAAAILVARKGVIVLHKGFGKMSPQPGAAPVTADSVFAIASISKPFAVAALMRLVEQGLVALRDPVDKYLPELQGGERHKMRVQDILSHVSGLPDMPPDNVELRRRHAPLSAFVKSTMTAPLLFTPGTGFEYQSMGILLAAEIVERITKARLPDLLRKDFFDPLGMKASSLGIGSRANKETAFCQGAPQISVSAQEMEDFGPNSAYWRGIGNPWGGMHSTVKDVARFLQMFLNGGVYGGKRVLSPATTRAMTTNQNPKSLPPWGLGWGLNESRAFHDFGDLGSESTFGHPGSTGTVAWADPATELIGVIFTTRPFDEDHGFLLRRVSNVIHSSVEE